MSTCSLYRSKTCYMISNIMQFYIYSIKYYYIHILYFTVYNALLNSDRLIGCLSWSRDIE